VKPMRPLRLLLAEDNAVNRELALRLLRKRGHEVVVATNGREALDLLETAGFAGFDAVLMDVQMPEMDGMEATAAIRARERVLGTHIPIIGVTAHAMKGDRERCIDGGMDGYVSKPIRPDIFFSELARLVPASPQDRSAPSKVPFAASPGAAMALDRDALLERVEGDLQLLGDIIELFKKDSVRQMATIQEAIRRRDAEFVKRAAHTLKGTCSNLGAHDAAAASLDLERFAAAQDFPRAEEALRSLEAHIDQVGKLLDEFRAECIP
jgi:two-component system sensor histidine kinase/response regulator